MGGFTLAETVAMTGEVHQRGFGELEVDMVHRGRVEDRATPKHQPKLTLALCFCAVILPGPAIRFPKVIDLDVNNAKPQA